MRKIFTQLFMVMALTAITLGVQARNTGYGDLIDLGQLELNTEYNIAGDFSDYIGTFVAPTSGTLIATGSNSTVLEPYYAKLDDMEADGNHIAVNYDNYYGAKQYHFDVIEGTTYYFYIGFSMNAFTFTLSMDSGEGIQIAKCTPEAGSTFSVSGGGLVSVQFNRAVIVDNNAKIIVGDKEATVAVNGQANIYSMEIKEPIFNWLNDGTLKGGDKFTIRIFNVKAADDATLLYGTDGTAEIEYIVGEMPIQLISTSNTSGTFYSYYPEGDEQGIVSLRFDGEIASAQATLTFGSTDVEGDYYVEELTPIIEGNTLSVNLCGKHRTPENMVASGTNYNNVTISFNKVLDTTGQHAYSAGQGTIGGYSFTYNALEVVTAEVYSEFTPASGSRLATNISHIEIWITDEAKLQYDGVLFKYISETDGVREEVVYNDMIEKYYEEAEVDAVYPPAAVLTVPVPNITEGDSEIEVTLHNLTCSDGLDHTMDVYAKYYLVKAAIDKVFGDDVNQFTVYNTKGILVLHTTNRDEIKNLPQGIYIINGEKFLMTR